MIASGIFKPYKHAFTDVAKLGCKIFPYGLWIQMVFPLEVFCVTENIIGFSHSPRRWLYLLMQDFDFAQI